MDDPAEISSKVFSVDRDFFVFQKFPDEFAVDLPYAEKIAVFRLMKRDRCSAENFSPQKITIGPLGHHVIDEQFHGMDTVPTGFRDMYWQFSGVTRITKHEMVHAYHFVFRIVKASGDAGTEQG